MDTTSETHMYQGLATKLFLVSWFLTALYRDRYAVVHLVSLFPDIVESTTALGVPLNFP